MELEILAWSSAELRIDGALKLSIRQPCRHSSQKTVQTALTQIYGLGFRGRV